MKTIRRIPSRTALVALVALIALGAGTAFGATKTTAPPIGTGVVVIDTNLAYEQAAAAGTGMVLTPSGEILTNNHVIRGATTIKVVVPGTKHSYTASVLGYDATRDVAVLQLQNATNLKTAGIGNSSALAVGAKVNAVGNANGAGKLTSAKGTVTGLDKSINVQDESGGTEQLSSLIETNVQLQPGDSGGPLLNASGKVVGMNTAASTGFGVAFAAYDRSPDAYAIPINTATAIAGQIVAGTGSATVHVGGTAFLGIDVGGPRPAPLGGANGASAQGVMIAGIVSDGSAAAAGLTQGDVITSVDGTAVTTSTGLQSVIQAHKPGDAVNVTYADSTGQNQSATVTLGSGPPL
jgi:S1-C subfamily serine protease